MAETKPGPDTIRALAEKLILETVRRDENGRAVGHPYAEILRRIKEVFPEANTTNACLRWYAVHLNEQPDVRMPLRPRRKSPGRPVAVRPVETEDPCA